MEESIHEYVIHFSSMKDQLKWTHFIKERGFVGILIQTLLTWGCDAVWMNLWSLIDVDLLVMFGQDQPGSHGSIDELLMFIVYICFIDEIRHI